jgi:hypothetical protein
VVGSGCSIGASLSCTFGRSDLTIVLDCGGGSGGGGGGTTTDCITVVTAACSSSNSDDCEVLCDDGSNDDADEDEDEATNDSLVCGGDCDCSSTNRSGSNLVTVGVVVVLVEFVLRLPVPKIPATTTAFARR